MKNIRSFLFVAAGALLLSGASAFADGEYQVTGTVTALSDKSVTVVKGKENFVIARDAATPVTGGDVKAGDKVTVYYTITATKMEDKGPAAGGKKGAKADAAPSAAPAAPAASAASPAAAKAKP